MTRRWLVVLQVVLGIALAAGLAQAGLSWLASARAARVPAGHLVLRPPADVQALALVEGLVWSGGKDGLALFDSQARPQPVPAGLAALRFVGALLSEPDGSVWIAHEDGVTQWRRPAAGQDASIVHYSSLAGAFPGRGLALRRDRTGTLWAGSDRGLARLLGAAFVPVPFTPEINPMSVDLIYEDRAGTLWLGDGSPRAPGLVRREADGWRLFTPEHGLPHRSVNTLAEQRGREGLWIGTGFAGAGGAAWLHQGRWQPVGRAQGLAGDKVRTIVEDSTGRLWFGSEYDGIVVMAATDHQATGLTRLAWLTEREGLAGPEVKAVLEHPAGTFWLGTNGGLTRIARLDTGGTAK